MKLLFFINYFSLSKLLQFVRDVNTSPNAQFNKLNKKKEGEVEIKIYEIQNPCIFLKSNLP